MSMCLICHYGNKAPRRLSVQVLSFFSSPQEWGCTAMSAKICRDTDMPDYLFIIQARRPFVRCCRWHFSCTDSVSPVSNRNLSQQQQKHVKFRDFQLTIRVPSQSDRWWWLWRRIMWVSITQRVDEPESRSNRSFPSRCSFLFLRLFRM